MALLDATQLLTMYGAIGLVALAVALFKWNSLRKKKAENWKPSEMDPAAVQPQAPESEPAKENILDELGLPAKDAIPAAQPPAPSEEEGLFAKDLPLEPEPKKQLKELPPARQYAPPAKSLKCEHCGKTFKTRHSLNLHKYYVRQKQKQSSEVK